jgi:glycosyltransferase involved in cell wall biosynthesis
MTSSSKIISALQANWWLNLAGLLLSFLASVVLVRAIPRELFAQYAAVLAIVGVATLVFEAGANSGLTRYLREASECGATGTFYLRMQRRRWIAAIICAVAVILLGPIYARSTQLGGAASERWVFICVAVLVAATLTKLLAHYGLLALFEAKTALLLQQGFLVFRSVSLGFGDKVAWEAMGCGRPCLVANDDLRETLGRYEKELLFRDGDPTDLATKLRSLLERSSAQRSEIGLYLREQVERLHSLPRLTTRVLDELQALSPNQAPAFPQRVTPEKECAW